MHIPSTNNDLVNTYFDTMLAIGLEHFSACDYDLNIF